MKFLAVVTSPSIYHGADKLMSVIGPATRVRGLTDNSYGLTPSHAITKVTTYRVIEAKAYSDYIKILSLKL